MWGISSTLFDRAVKPWRFIFSHMCCVQVVLFKDGCMSLFSCVCAFGSVCFWPFPVFINTFQANSHAGAAQTRLQTQTAWAPSTLIPTTLCSETCRTTRIATAITQSKRVRRGQECGPEHACSVGFRSIIGWKWIMTEKTWTDSHTHSLFYRFIFSVSNKSKGSRRYKSPSLMWVRFWCQNLVELLLQILAKSKSNVKCCLFHKNMAKWTNREQLLILLSIGSNQGRTDADWLLRGQLSRSEMGQDYVTAVLLCQCKFTHE